MGDAARRQRCAQLVVVEVHCDESHVVGNCSEHLLESGPFGIYILLLVDLLRRDVRQSLQPVHAGV